MRNLFVFLWALLAFSATAATHVRLALNWKPEAEFGGFYEAQRIGSFHKHALEVEIIPGGVGTPVVQMVAAGRVEFGISTADELVTSRARGTDVIGLFAVYQTNPQGLMTQALRGVKEIGDVLKSGTLAIQKGMPYYLWLEKKYGGIGAAVVPFQGGIGQMASDKNLAQQCYVTSEPIAVRQRGIEPSVFLIAESGYNPYSTLLVTRLEYLKKNRKTVDALLAAVREGWRGYLNDPRAANALMAKLNPTMDGKTLAASAVTQKPLIENEQTSRHGLGSMTVERWATLSEQLRELKVIDKVEPAPSYFYDRAGN